MTLALLYGRSAQLLVEGCFLGTDASTWARLGWFGLLTPPNIVDEMGCIPFEAEAANLFMQLIPSRHERGSDIVTSNKTFSIWGDVFGDPVLAAAMIDQLAHHAEILSLKGSPTALETRRLPAP